VRGFRGERLHGIGPVGSRCHVLHTNGSKVQTA
jgi:hypothetical protein